MVDETKSFNYNAEIGENISWRFELPAALDLPNRDGNRTCTEHRLMSPGGEDAGQIHVQKPSTSKSTYGDKSRSQKQPHKIVIIVLVSYVNK